MARRCLPGIHIVVLGPDSDVERVEHWSRLGAQVCLAASTSVEAVVCDLEYALGHDRLIVDEACQRASSRGRAEALSELLGRLTRREMEVLHLVCLARSNAEIAGLLSLTLGAVEGHLVRVYAKLNVGTRSEAIERARLLGLR